MRILALADRTELGGGPKRTGAQYQPFWGDGSRSML